MDTDAMTTLVITVPEDKIGCIIGVGGKGLRRIWQETRVKTVVPRQAAVEGGRTIELTGTPKQLWQAQLMVQQIVEESNQPPPTLPPQFAQAAVPAGMVSQAVAAAAAAGMKRKLPSDFGQSLGGMPMHGQPVHPQWVMQQLGGAPQYPPNALIPAQYTAVTPGGMSGLKAIDGVECKVVIADDKVGTLIGKGGAGLKTIREASGAQFSLNREPVLGGRLLVIQPPLAVQERCLALVCERLGTTAEGTATPVTLKVLFPSQLAGQVIGKGGAGLRTIRDMGLTVDMPREDVGMGVRVLTLAGPGPARAAAAGTVMSKLAAKRESEAAMQDSLFAPVGGSPL